MIDILFVYIILIKTIILLHDILNLMISDFILRAEEPTRT